MTSSADWMDDALCAQTDPDLFLIEQGGSSKPAKKVCVTCSVRLQCLQYALDHNEQWGIWGGLSRRQRNRLKVPR